MNFTPSINKSAIQRRLLPALFFLLLFALCWINGMAKIADWRGPGSTLSNEFYVPAIMISAGYGFNLVDIHAVPGLRAFLDYDATAFDIANIPEDIALHAPAPVHVYHKNLIYLAAFAWRLFGVSWDAIKILLVVLFFVCAALVYAISRQALSPLWSGMVALAYALNDGVLMALYHLRDFSKAPFILFVFLLLCIAIRRRLSWRRYLLIAFFIGASLGVGMGFRRDMLALLPLAVIILVSCRISQTSRPGLVRLAAAIMVSATFTVLGWPALYALYPERSINAHDMIMGFSSRADAEAGFIVPASYEKHFLLDDNYSTFQAFRAAQLGFSVSTDDYYECQRAMEQLAYDYFLKRNYVLYIARTFPADMLTRSYAAVLRITTGIFRNKFAPFEWLELFSFPLMIIAFLVIAVYDPYRAWQLVALVCFFCGYASLQFSLRHAFHMTFVGYFFSAFVLSRIFNGLRFLCAQGNVAEMPRLLHKQRRRIALAGGWMLITLAAFIIPLQLARAAQVHSVRQLREGYNEAARMPLPHKTLRWEGRTLFVPEDDYPCHDCEIEQARLQWFRTRVLVARFKPGDETPMPVLMYEWDTPGPEFTSPAAMHTRPGTEPGYIDYYFPVHTTITSEDWDRFAGLLLPDHQAHRFEGFHEVVELEGLGGLFGMTIPENLSAFSYAQTLRLPWPHTFPADYAPGFSPYCNQEEDGVIKHLLNAGNAPDAIKRAEAMLERRPESIQFGVLLVRALLHHGDSERAYRVIDALRNAWPDDYGLYARLDRCFDRLGGVEARYAHWRRLAETQDACAQHYMERAQLHSGSFPN